LPDNSEGGLNADRGLKRDDQFRSREGLLTPAEPLQAVENLDAYESASVHYWATRIEARLCVDQEVVLVGGGNSAGQATPMSKCSPQDAGHRHNSPSGKAGISGLSRQAEEFLATG
jgi:hypothetical protein